MIKPLSIQRVTPRFLAYAMGIAGLYKYLSPCVTECHIRKFAGKTIAIDMPCWVHRGAIADAQKIVMGGPTHESAVIGSLMKIFQFLLVKCPISDIC